MPVEMYNLKCTNCKEVTVWHMIGSRQLKNGKKKVILKCRYCGVTKSVREDKLK